MLITAYLAPTRLAAGDGYLLPDSPWIQTITGQAATALRSSGTYMSSIKERRPTLAYSIFRSNLKDIPGRSVDGFGGACWDIVAELSKHASSIECSVLFILIGSVEGTPWVVIRAICSRN